MNLLVIKDQVQHRLTTYWETIQQYPAYQKVRTYPPFLQVFIFGAVLSLALLLFLALLYGLFGITVVVGFIASVLAGLATGLGALPAVLFKNVKLKVLHIMLGGAAGVMLAATAFSLIVPGIQYGNEVWQHKGIFLVAFGMLFGAVFLDFADRRLPHDFFSGPEGIGGSLRKVWLFIIAITIHNFPEGLAVGVSFGADDWKNGTVLAIAIGLQNIPEGLAVALPLVGLGFDRWKAVLIGALTGLVEPVGGLLGVTSVTAFYPLLPVGMGFAAGAMLFVISDDIIPETQSTGKARAATFAVLGGFIIMMMLDNMLS